MRAGRGKSGGAKTNHPECPECCDTGLARRGACTRCFAGATPAELLQYVDGELSRLITVLVTKAHIRKAAEHLESASTEIKARLYDLLQAQPKEEPLIGFRLPDKGPHRE